MSGGRRIRSVRRTQMPTIRTPTASALNNRKPRRSGLSKWTNRRKIESGPPTVSRRQEVSINRQLHGCGECSVHLAAERLHGLGTRIAPSRA